MYMYVYSSNGGGGGYSSSCSSSNSDVHGLKLVQWIRLLGQHLIIM